MRISWLEAQKGAGDDDVIGDETDAMQGVETEPEQDDNDEEASEEE